MNRLLNYNLFFLFLCAYLFSQSSTRPSGTGISSDPYLIGTLSELYWISEQVYNGTTFSGKYFKQINNVDASDTSNWSEGWLPIGGRSSTNNSDTTNPFAGTYDGYNYSISNLYINNTKNLNGLFGSIYNNTIENVHLINVTITTTGLKTGALIGYKYLGQVNNSSSSGTVVSSNGTLGGLIGQNLGGSINKSFSTSTVIQTNSNVVGGLVGTNQGRITDCYTNGLVQGLSQIGGLIGQQAGDPNNSVVSYSYSNSTVSLYSGNNTSIGGIVGYVQSNSTINNTNYWNTSKINNGYGELRDSSATFNGLGKTDSELKQVSSFSGWDFVNIWTMGSSGYPTTLSGFYIDTSTLNLTLTDTDDDNIVSNSDLVTITATFSEAMAATPTISLSGIVSNAIMTSTSSNSVWTYTWSVSTTVTSTIATVSGTNLAGNVYSGTESITYTIDDSAYLVLDSNGITVKATNNAIVGNSYALNGILYTVVDNSNISTQISAGNYNL
ncbi:MAG: hypothetical protein VW262_07480, partial [Flavobacteriaceae bacterium]